MGGCREEGLETRNRELVTGYLQAAIAWATITDCRLPTAKDRASHSVPHQPQHDLSMGCTRRVQGRALGRTRCGWSSRHSRAPVLRPFSPAASGCTGVGLPQIRTRPPSSVVCGPWSVFHAHHFSEAMAISHPSSRRPGAMPRTTIAVTQTVRVHLRGRLMWSSGSWAGSEES